MGRSPLYEGCDPLLAVSGASAICDGARLQCHLRFQRDTPAPFQQPLAGAEGGRGAGSQLVCESRGTVHELVIGNHRSHDSPLPRF